MLDSTVPAGQHDQAAEGRGQRQHTTRSTSSTWSRSRPAPTRIRRATSCRPASPSRTCRTRSTRPAWTRPATCSASTCRPAPTTTASKFQVYGKAMQVVGAGPWYTRFQTRRTRRTPTPASTCRVTANGSTFERLRLLRQLHVAHRRAGQGLRRAAERVEPDHRQHLGRAHRLHVLGRAQQQHHHHATPGSATPSPTGSTSPTTPPELLIIQRSRAAATVTTRSRCSPRPTAVAASATTATCSRTSRPR